MSIAESTPNVSVAEADGVVKPQPTPRTLGKRVMHWVRRLHLYFGLFLLPWAVLYGVTAFLFNHPTVFSDQPTTTFDRAVLVETPMESPPPPAQVALEVVAALQARAKDGERYTLVQPEKAQYTREFAFATVKSGDQQISVLLDVTGNGGTVRGRTEPPTKPEEKAPFAAGGGGRPGAPPGGGGPSRGGSRPDDSLKLAEPLHERVKSSVPAVLDRTGFPQGEVTVTSVPDLRFLMRDANDKVWRVTYNSQTGSVSGRPEDETSSEPMSLRRFLTRLHVSHGFPSSVGARWFWAVIVDTMAGVMVFWGVSGLFMWWQLKSTRLWGFLVLLVSAVAAVGLVWGMHAALTS